MGQLVYDNLFWNRTFKDIAMVTVRSVGWNLGTKREVLGGLIDTLQFVLGRQRLYRPGAGGGGIMGPPPPPQLPGGVTPGPGQNNYKWGREFSRRMAYIIGMVLVVMWYGGIYNKLATGEYPSDIFTFFKPKTGTKDENGRDERVDLPAYTKDMYSYYKHPARTAGHKTNPLIGKIIEMWNNRDFFNTEIYHPGDPAPKIAADLLEETAKTFAPFSATSSVQRAKTAGEEITINPATWLKLLKPELLPKTLQS